MGGGDLPFSWGLSISHRRTTTEYDEDEDKSEGWTLLDDSKDLRFNRMWVAHPSPYRIVTS